MQKLNLDTVHPSWRPIIDNALNKVDQHYIQHLQQNPNWLPGPACIFNAFSLPLANMNYILFGESPYPRAQSANGYAFMDAAVEELWSNNGLSKQVNRATSLRNFIKMLLVAQGYLTGSDTSQQAIASLDKSHLVQTCKQLFDNMMNHGILLLNACLVLSDQSVTKDAKQWQPFMEAILENLLEVKPGTQLILFGNIAKAINKLPAANKLQQFSAEHPYNISFINNHEVLTLFKPLEILSK